MSTRVVSTKLTEEEHTRLLDACNGRGCTPLALIKEAILEKVAPKEQVESSEKGKEMTDGEIRKFLGIKPKYIGIRKT